MPTLRGVSSVPIIEKRDSSAKGNSPVPMVYVVESPESANVTQYSAGDLSLRQGQLPPRISLYVRSRSFSVNNILYLDECSDGLQWAYHHPDELLEPWMCTVDCMLSFEKVLSAYMWPLC